MNFDELRLARISYLLSNCKDFDNREYLERLSDERDMLLEKLLD